MRGLYISFTTRDTRLPKTEIQREILTNNLEELPNMQTPGNGDMKKEQPEGKRKSRKQRKDEEKHRKRLAAEAEARGREKEEKAPPPIPTAELMYVRIEDIAVGKRFRQEYDIESLIESIKDKGMLQPITLDSNFELKAGGRRLRAAEAAGLEEVPAIVREVSDEIDSREIELIENIEREDLVWQDRIRLTEEIDILFKDKYGTSSAGVGQGWSGRKTAELLSRSHGSVQMALALASGMRLIPGIAECKNETEARKMLKKLEEAMLVKRMRKEQNIILDEHEETSDDEWKETIEDIEDPKEKLRLTQERKRASRLSNARNNFFVGDAMEGLKELAELYSKQESAIRFLEVDPPFGISLQEIKKRANRGVASTLDKYEEIPEEEYGPFLAELTQLLYAVANKNCWMVFWYGPTWTSQVRSALVYAGWSVDHIPAIWVKGEEESSGSGQTGSPERYLARATEFFFVCRRGAPLLGKEGRTNVFAHKPVAPSKKYHPTQKPLALYQDILDTFAFPNSVLCSPFLGSATILRAAYKKGVLGLGWDLNEKNKDRFLIEVEEDLDREEREETGEEEEEG